MVFKDWIKTAALVYLGYGATDAITSIVTKKDLTMPTKAGISFVFPAACAPIKKQQENIDVYLSLENHLDGEALSPEPTKESSIKPGSVLSINLANYNLSGVSKKFGVALNDAGRRVAYTFDGTLDIIVPSDATKNLDYKIIMMDIGTEKENELYESAYEFIANQWMTNNHNVLPDLKRILPVHREDRDGRTGPEEVWTKGSDCVLALMNIYLGSPENSSVKGKLDLKTTTTANPMGFAYCFGFDGDHGTGIWIDPKKFNNIKDPDIRLKVMKRIAMTEAVEKFGFNNLFGEPSSDNICDPGQYLLNGTGVRVLRFCVAYAQQEDQ